MRDEEERKGKREYPLNAVRVCIDSCGDEICGRIYSRMSEECLVFKNAAQLLLRTDRLLDVCGYPQAFQIKRSFAPEGAAAGRHALPELILGEEQVSGQRGNICTFDIFIGSRRRTSWQGYITDEKEASVKYRSELELLREIWRVLKAEREP